MKKTVGLIALFAVVFLSSCLKGDNVSVLNNLIGTYEAVQLSGSQQPQLMVRLDVDGSVINFPHDTVSVKPGDRVMVSFKIDYDNQSAEASKNGYFDVTNVLLNPIETLFSEEESSADILPQDPILVISKGYMMKTLGAPERYLFTLEGYYNSGNTTAHEFQLLRKSFDVGVENDTLRYELRHDKKGDVENQLNKHFLYSFDCSYEMNSLAVSEKTLVIELSYMDKQGIVVKSHLNYRYPKY